MICKCSCLVLALNENVTRTVLLSVFVWFKYFAEPSATITPAKRFNFIDPSILRFFNVALCDLLSSTRYSELAQSVVKMIGDDTTQLNKFPPSNWSLRIS